MTLSLASYQAVVAVVGVWGLLKLVERLRRKGRSLPGPPGLPLIGNLLDVPKPGEVEAAVYGRLCDKYGPIVGLNVMGLNIVVLEDPEDVKQLLWTRAASYSNRPHLQMVLECGWGDGIAMIQPGADLTGRRRLMNSMLGKLGLKECLGVQDECVKLAVLDLAESTGDFRPAVKRLAGEVILRLAYGYKPKSLDDRFVNLSQDALYVFLETVTPDWLVNVFPIFRHVPAWVPFQGWRRTAREGRKLVEAANSEPFEWAREQLSKGAAEPSSFTARFLPQVQDNPEELRQLQHSVNNLYAAGFDTTQAAGQWLLVLLALHPEVQSRAQAEIDGITGNGARLPTYDDREAGKTPYLDAIVKEVWRWAAFVPLALPHATAREDYYKGYVIPKGAIVLPSTWRMMHNPQKYPEPNKFNPDRFLGQSQRHDSDIRSMIPEMLNEDPMHYIFGYGPRQCPGRYFVDATTWLFAAHVLSTLDLSEAMDLNGQRLTKETVTFLPGVVGYPNSNGVRVQVRSQRAVAILNEAVER